MKRMKTPSCLPFICLGVAMSACQPASLPAGRTIVSAPQVPTEQDAHVKGTTFNAAAEIRCSGLADPNQTACPAGVIRRQDGASEVHVTGSSGARTLYFDASQRGLRADPSVGTFRFSIDREKIITIGVGEESYTFPVEFLRGD